MDDFTLSRQQKRNPFKCEICDKEFKNKNGLRSHFNGVHNLMKDFQCNICQKVFTFENKLAKHMKIVHENEKRHKCDTCSKFLAH